MSELAYTRCGGGAPLVLLHGIGSLRQAWTPVIPILARQFDVIAIDMPGFGESDPLPAHIEPTPAALAAEVAGFLDTMGVDRPHVAGNSLGGWVALEFARLRPVASLALLSPAGLWRGRNPMYNRISLRGMRLFSRYAPGLLSWLVGGRLGRILILGQIHGRPTRVDPDYARMEIRALGTSAGFEATARAVRTRHYRAGSASDAPVTAPITVAFGSRDYLLLPHQSRHFGQLPPGTHFAGLPGCGHVPMPDDPDAVAAFIVEASARMPAAR